MSKAEAVIQCLAPAKVNLALRVLGRRADGYHSIESLMVAISLYDSVEIRARYAGAATAVECRCTGPEPAPSGPANLAAKAAVAVLDELGADARVSLRIDKRIPPRAGLGGGSSDAAAVLRHLPGLLGRRIAAARVRAMAVALGADVPFFLSCRPSLATGVGEVLEPLDRFPRLTLAVVVPPVGVETAWAYAHALPAEATRPIDDEGRGARRRVFGAAGLRLSRERLLSRLSNDFEAGVAARYAHVARVRETLRELGAVGTVMSGSGSAVVGVFEQASRARAAVASFGGRDRAFAVRVLSGRPAARRDRG
jgi:4-diphosphocytidyl-2-C-methyl-D-erythritol kinase